MNRIVWIAVATYAPEDDVEPLLGVGETKEAAERALRHEIAGACVDFPDAVEQWIAEEAKRYPVYS